MCEMLWSDPKAAEGRGPSQRGVGVGFGPDVTRNFLEDNQLDLLVRSHEVGQACADCPPTGHLHVAYCWWISSLSTSLMCSVI